MIVSAPLASVVYSKPSVLTTPSTEPARPPPCRRIRSPTRKVRAFISTVPAITFPSVCCEASPATTAVAAPPKATVRVPSPATRAATTATIIIVTKRIRKPTVPAVPGSIRLNRLGPSALPTSRANCQPTETSAIAMTTRTAVSQSRGKRTLRSL